MIRQWIKFQKIESKLKGGETKCSRSCPTDIPMYSGSAASPTASEWLQDCRRCMKQVILNDCAEMCQFGPEPVYITSLKNMLMSFNPEVQYSKRNKICPKDKSSEELFEFCANRRGFLLYFKKEIIGNPKRADNPDLAGLPGTLPTKISRATQNENNNIKYQFNFYTFHKKDTRYIRNRTTPIFVPDFFSPVPPYPLKIYSESEDVVLGFTDQDHCIYGEKVKMLNKDGNETQGEYPLNLKLEEAHIVDSAEWSWVQLLVNKTTDKDEFPAIDQVTSLQDQIKIKQRLINLFNSTKDEIYKDSDKRPDYFTVPDDQGNSGLLPENWIELLQSGDLDLSDIELGTNDSAANMLLINHHAHHRLFDRMQKTPAANMSGKRFHGFVTVDTTGQAFGVAPYDSKSRSWVAYPKAEVLTRIDTGVGPQSKVNPFWLDISEEMKQTNPIQWLQNYRRKRWIQIRNIFYAFMLQASEIQQEEQDPPPDLVSMASILRKNQNAWSEAYDEAYKAYENGEWIDYTPPKMKKSENQTKKMKNLTSSMKKVSLKVNSPKIKKWYLTTKQNETLTKIARTLKLDSSVLLKLNKSMYPTITKNAKLRINTQIRLH